MGRGGNGAAGSILGRSERPGSQPPAPQGALGAPQGAGTAPEAPRGDGAATAAASCPGARPCHELAGAQHGCPGSRWQRGAGRSSTRPAGLLPCLSSLPEKAPDEEKAEAADNPRAHQRSEPHQAPGKGLSAAPLLWDHHRNFLRDVLLAGGPDSPHARVMRGQITLSQLFSEVEEGCKQHASAAGIALPPTFSIARAFEEMAAKGAVNAPLLRAAGVLRRNGFKTGIFTNNWVDDSAGRLFTATLLGALRRHFDVVIESCRAGLHKPDPRLYAHALEVLQAKPQDVILLDDIGENLKPAREMGMATILVRDTETVLKELQELSGVQLLHQDEPLPTACDPADVSHGYVPIRPGVQLHFVEMGQGPPVCLCHGFPEVWLSWRYQIPALADAGFRVIALEMKGYGESTAPPDVGEYSQEQICKDLAVFLDKLGIPQAVFIGHDWGGAVVWNMALFYPERVRAVASLNTPYRPADPAVDIVEKMKSIPTFDYQFYFQEPGVAEAELEKDVGRTLKALIRSTRQEDRLPSAPSFLGIQERGGLLVGFPENPPESLILHGPELQYYIQRFQKSGFRGPLNWYRNMRPNWRWALTAKDRKILMPALMVTAGKDVVLHPSMSKGMEEWVPQLRRGHLEECGHWTQMERPAALNKILVEWLEGLPADGAVPRVSRL